MSSDSIESDQEQFEQDEDQVQMSDEDVSQDDNDDEDNEDESEQQRLEEEEKLIKEQLKHASFETIMKIKQKQKELEMQKQQLRNKQRKSKSADTKSFSNKKEEKIEDKRAHKGAPLERSAKKPVSVFQTILSSKKVQIFDLVDFNSFENNSFDQIQKFRNYNQYQFIHQQQKGRDPRFDGLSGSFNATYFNNSYKFIDEMKQREVDILSKDVKKNKYSEEEKLILKKELGKIKSELKQKEYNDRKKDVVDKYKKKAKEAISQGQLPYFAKKNQIKDDVLKMQFDKLESQGKLEKVLKKKRKQQSDKLMAAYSLITHKKIKKD